MTKILEVLSFLTKELPHRGSTTIFENQASRYVARQLKDLGFTIRTQYFSSATSAYYPAMLFGLINTISIIAHLVYPSSLVTVVSVCFLTLSLVSILLDAAFKPNIFSWVLPTRHSQNIIAHLPSLKTEKQKLVVMAHIDSHRTPLLFSSPFWVKVLKSLVPSGIVFSLISIIAMLVNLSIILYLSLFFFIVLAVLMAQADFTPYTTGANDNASGVATLVGIASEFMHRPLDHTSIYFVVSGCEEVGSYGSRAFVQKYHQELGDCYWLTLDGLSAQKSQLAIIGSEKFFLEVKSDPNLVHLAKSISKKNKKIKSFYLPQYQGAYTDSSPAGLAGFKIISFLALRPDGVLPSWHTLGDNYSSVDKQTLTNCYLFTSKFIRELDTI